LLGPSLARPKPWGGLQGLAAWSYLPAALLGAVAGLACYRRIEERQFQLALNLLLIASGLSFVM